MKRIFLKSTLIDPIFAKPCALPAVAQKVSPGISDVWIVA